MVLEVPWGPLDLVLQVVLDLLLVLEILTHPDCLEDRKDPGVRCLRGVLEIPEFQQDQLHQVPLMDPLDLEAPQDQVHLPVRRFLLVPADQEDQLNHLVQDLLLVLEIQKDRFLPGLHLVQPDLQDQVVQVDLLTLQALEIQVVLVIQLIQYLLLHLSDH